MTKRLRRVPPAGQSPTQSCVHRSDRTHRATRRTEWPAVAAAFEPPRIDFIQRDAALGDLSLLVAFGAPTESQNAERRTKRTENSVLSSAFCVLCSIVTSKLSTIQMSERES